MTTIELDMIQGCFPPEILCAVASKWWYHLFIADAGTLWLVQCGGVVRWHLEGCFYAGILYQRWFPK